jgi:hypothetical protein
MKARGKWAQVSRGIIELHDRPPISMICNILQAQCLQLNKQRWKRKYDEGKVWQPTLPNRKREDILSFFVRHKHRVDQEYERWMEIPEKFHHHWTYDDSEWRRWILYEKGAIFLDALARTYRSFMHKPCSDHVVWQARLMRMWQFRNLRVA